MLSKLFSRISDRRTRRTKRLRHREFEALSEKPQHIITVESKNGELSFSNKDKVIGKFIYIERHWEYDWIERVLTFLKSNNLLTANTGTLINVGANIGANCIALLREKHFSQGFAFEPDPLNLELLRKNIAQNQLADVITVFPMGLSSENTQATLSLSSTNHGDHRVQLQSAENDTNCHTIELKRLDDVVKAQSLELTKPSILWVDIQGHEGHFFEGAQETLKNISAAICEFNPGAMKLAGTDLASYIEIVNKIYNTVHIYNEDLDTFQSNPISHLLSYQSWENDDQREINVIYTK